MTTAAFCYGRRGSGIAQIAANHVPVMGGTISSAGLYDVNGGFMSRSARVRDMGAKGKWSAKHGPGIGPLKQGKLVRLGYSATKERPPVIAP